MVHRRASVTDILTRLLRCLDKARADSNRVRYERNLKNMVYIFHALDKLIQLLHYLANRSMLEKVSCQLLLNENLNQNIPTQNNQRKIVLRINSTDLLLSIS